MLDANDFLKLIKRASKEALEAEQPSDFCFGKVVSSSPLNILVEQKMTLGANQLILTRNVSDFKMKISVDWEKDGIEGEREITVHNSLSVGEKVVLLKKKGGQKYLVLDRVVNL